VATTLIIDDSDAQRAEIRAVVESSDLFARVLEASDGFQGLKLLLAESVDVVLCDLEMPGLEGEKLLHLKSSSPGVADVPFVFLTASEDRDRRARLLDGGACDAITKPFHPGDLVARLRLHLKVKRLQEELLVKNATLARLSTVDALTGLRSRRYGQECLAIEFLRARRYRTPLTIGLADLDYFKRVNDRFGHPGGDAVLRGVSELLRESVRATDVACRYGGEELLVVMHQNTARGGRIWAERWRGQVEEARFSLPDGRKTAITVSVGIAELHPGLESPKDLVAAADAALYQAKESGRNRVEVAATPVA
jgi:diguanylate cyclase (GGDEF)-like protein